MEYSKLIKFLLAITLVFFSISLVISLPPILPTRVYGKVMTDDGKPVGLTQVTATWKDFNETEKKTSTLTFGFSNNMVGYYYFSDIDAEDGSVIILNSSGKSVKVMSDPGSLIMADAIILNKKLSLFEFISSFFEKNDQVTIENNNTESENKDENNQKNNSSENSNQNKSNEDNYKNNSSSQDNIKKDFQRKNPSNNSSQKFAPIILGLPNNILICMNQKLDLDFIVNHPEIGKIDSLIIHNFKESPFRLNLRSENYYNKTYTLSSDIMTKRYLRLINKDYAFYQEDISFSDGTYADEKKVNITVIGINNIPVLDNIKTTTFEILNNNNIVTKVQDIEDNINNLKIDISPKNILELNITSKENIDLVLKQKNLGVYNMTLCIKDNGLNNPYENISYCNNTGRSYTVCDNFTLAIVDKNFIPFFIDSYPKRDVIIENFTNVSFKSSFNDNNGNHLDAFWYVDDKISKFSESVLQDSFSYGVNCKDNKPHVIKLEITDGLLNKSIEWNISTVKDLCNEEKLKDLKMTNNLELNSKSSNFFSIFLIVIVVISVIILLVLLMNLIRQNIFLKIRLNKVSTNKL